MHTRHSYADVVYIYIILLVDTILKNLQFCFVNGVKTFIPKKLKLTGNIIQVYKIIPVCVYVKITF